MMTTVPSETRVTGVNAQSNRDRTNLIQDNNMRPFEDRAGNGDTLFFASRQFESSFAHHCVVALGKLDDARVHFGGSRGPLNLLWRCAVSAVANVVGDGVVEENRVLQRQKQAIRVDFILECSRITLDGH